MNQATDIDRSAPVIVRVERTISAPIETIWRLHTNVDRWPTWQEDIGEAKLDGPFAPQSVFTWRTAGFDDAIRSTIHVVQPHVLTLWGGPASGIDGLHRWDFQAVGGDTHIVTEESFAGGPVEAAADQLRSGLTTSLERWLEALDKAAAAT